MNARRKSEYRRARRPPISSQHIPTPTKPRPILNSKSKMTPRNAFTLIELLAVISIIVMLMALLLPALSRIRKQTRAVICRANLKQWSTILVLYTNDSEGCLPRYADDAMWLLRGSLTSEADVNEPDGYNPIRTQGIACCPLATEPAETGIFTMTRRASGSIVWQLEGTPGSTFSAWQVLSPPPPFHASYGFNNELFSFHFQHGLMLRPFSSKGVDTHMVPNKEATPVLLDSAHPCCSLRSKFQRPPRFARMGEMMGCINRHHGCINGLFMDWSARSIGLKELWTLKWNPEFDTRGPWTKAGGVQPEDWPKWMRGFKTY